MDRDFSHTTLGNTGIGVHRLGLSATYRPGKKAIYKALDEGINYFFGFGIDTQMTGVMRDVLKSNREQCVVASGAYGYIFGHFDLRRTFVESEMLMGPGSLPIVARKSGSSPYGDPVWRR